MSIPQIIIISGPPGTGKTSLGHTLSEKLNLPYISKDELQEILFDEIGSGERPYIVKTTFAALKILFYILETTIKSGQSIIVESNFIPTNDNERFLKLKEKVEFTPIQIQLKANTEILIKRFKTRATSKDRHPGHGDLGSLNEYIERFEKGKYDPLNIGGEFIEVDTSDFSKINFDDIVTKINK